MSFLRFFGGSFPECLTLTLGQCFHLESRHLKNPEYLDAVSSCKAGREGAIERGDRFGVLTNGRKMLKCILRWGDCGGRRREL